ncbi:MAG TPA: DUF1801 domain-containing protein [Kofleriaceae bacterium]|jgi:hypothetical protein
MEKTPSQHIDDHVAKLTDWRGSLFAKLRAIVHQAIPAVEETWKWRGVPVWESSGIITTGETYPKYLKMTFAKGASLKDPAKLFNASLEGNMRRAIDFHEGVKINEKALVQLLRDAVALNESKPAKKPAAAKAPAPTAKKLPAKKPAAKKPAAKKR